MDKYIFDESNGLWYELNRYLSNINQWEEQIFHRRTKEMAEKQSVTEQ